MTVGTSAGRTFCGRSGVEMAIGLDRGLRGSDNWKLQKKDGRDNIVYKILIFQFRASCKEGEEKSLLSFSPVHQFTQS